MFSARIEVINHDLVAVFRQLAEKMLAMEGIDAVLIPKRLSPSAMVMPSLITDPGQLEGADPLAPAFAYNAATVVSRLTRKPSGSKVAVMLRPCEIRAFIELVKLNQGSLEEIVIIGSDCLGAMANVDYLSFTDPDGPASTRFFYQARLQNLDPTEQGFELSPACQACEHPFADGADLAVGLWGIDTCSHLLILAQSAKGDQLLRDLGYPPADIPPQRAEEKARIIGQHTDFRDRMFSQTGPAVDSLEKLTHYFSACVNCYNCRVACPVCYCRECVFVTDVFQHEPFQYIQWSQRHGGIKLPTDTLFYHLTRLAHMSLACVGCGQCSNACPNHIPVMELFRCIAHRTQAAFDYQPGLDVNQKPPLSEFKEAEFEEMIGIADG